MSIIKTKGIILAQSNMGDNDQMVTLLTLDVGKIGCAAKGAKSLKSNLMAGTQFLCFGEYIIYKGISSYKISSCEPIEIFYNLRLDYEKLKYASEISKVIMDVTNENENSYKVLQLLLNTLYMLSSTDKNMDFILSIFKIRLLSIIGFRPIINSCLNCYNKNVSYFSIMDDGFKCQNCGKVDRSAIAISTGTVKAIRYIIKSDAKKIYSFDINDESKLQLKIVSKLYLNKCLGKEFE